MSAKRDPEEVIGYIVELGGGRFAESVIGRLVYGNRPKWLTAVGGWTSSQIHNTSAGVSIPGYGYSLVTRHEYNAVCVSPEGEGSRIVAYGIAGKVGTVTEYTQAQWAANIAADYKRANGEATA